ncbi:Gldg family protein [Treponema sp. J25]|uniref:GldG family protein n=1 Tax=Treponema sp. J25 TaxID=2094121 RepID=UPI0010530E16|nr:Gldg family protein [Treponema sp. J25]TCW60840.1 ABC transporter [Treponema sp. J25]
MSKRELTIITVLVIVIGIMGFLVSGRLYVRWDITKNKSYTLSKVSRELYKEIPERVTITYYISDKLKAIHPIPQEIIDLLREYANHSRGRIRLVVQDPVKAGTAAVAEQLGVQPQQIQTVEQDQASVAMVYTGIVVEYLGKTEVMPVVFSLDTLEYDLTSRIRALVSQQERTLGVLIGDSGKLWSRDFGLLDKALTGAGYKIRQVYPGEEIPTNIVALFVIGGVEQLEDWDLYRIDYYLQQGGKVLFAVDGVMVDTQTGMYATARQDKGLLAMLSHYGVTVEKALLLDKACLTIPYQIRSYTGAVQFKLLRYPHWVTILAENGNKSHPVTANFQGIDLYWPSPLTLQAPSGIIATSLCSSSSEAWKMTKEFTVNPEMDYLFTTEQGTTKGQYTVAATLEGTFPSYFKGKPKPVRSGSSLTLPDLPENPKAGRVFVVGDEDLGSTLVQYTQSERNLDFLIQAADWLGNDPEILAIRTRTSQVGRLDRITDPVQRAAVALLAQLINIILIPLAVVIVAVIRIVGRKRRMRATMEVSQ